MSLTASDWEKINHCLLRLYRELDKDKHVRLMLEILNDLVPGDSIVMNYMTPPNRLAAITLPPDAVSDAQVALVGKYAHQSPYAYYLTTEDASWKMTTDFMPIEEFHQLDIHRFALAPLGINYQIGGMLASLDGTAHIVTIHRTHENFTAREQEILNTLHPHLVGSHINALLYGRSQTTVSELKAVMDTAPGAYGYFDATGKVVWLQEKAQAWLQKFFPHDVKTQNHIPQSIATLLARSQANGGTPEHIKAETKENFLTATLSLSPLGGWMLRLEQKSKQPLPRFRPLPQLSPAENDVLRWMAEGKRNAEIATILGLSPRTVENHVAQILAKLAVENRACAIIHSMEYGATSSPGETEVQI